MSLPRMVIVSSIFFTLLLLNSCSAPPGNPENGKRWYMMNNCYSCHGIHGNDGRAVNIAPLKMGFGRFVKRLRKTKSNIMPSFPETKITKQDAADIYSYLNSREKNINR